MYRNEMRAVRDERAVARDVDRDVDGDWADPRSPQQPPDSGDRPHSSPPTSLNADPDRLLQAARICLRRGRAKDAFTLMRQACGAAPHHLQCQALLAWLRVQRGEVRPADARPILELSSRAVCQHPEDLETRLYRARTLLRLGRATEALADFAFVANADPRNVEAARELGLASAALGTEADAVSASSRPFERAESRPMALKSTRAPAESTPATPEAHVAPQSGFFRGRARRR
jgi:tetratricopeptide (TPR) repeat protein